MPAPSAVLRDALVHALGNHFHTVSDLNQQAGIPTGSVQRFLSGERGLSLDTVDKLAPLLGLELVQKPPVAGSDS